MIDLTAIQAMLNKVSCPMCNSATLDVVLRCDLGYGECLATAKCRTCATTYKVTTADQVQEEGWLNRNRTKLEFRCDLASRECCYVRLPY